MLLACAFLKHVLRLRRTTRVNIFTTLYNWILRWAEHKFAPRILALLAFSESIFFPVPPDVLLAPMVLSKPAKAWKLASISTIASLLGGIVGYWLGYLMFEPWVQPLITEFGYQSKFDKIMDWFSEWGLMIVFVAGFSPIPYKLFTVSAGFLQLAFFPFVIASILSRGLRFFLVAGLIKYFGKAAESKLKRWIDFIGWACVVLLALAYLFFT